MNKLPVALATIVAVVAGYAHAGSVVLSTPVTIATDFRPGGVVVGDYNNDAKPDLLILNFTTVSMLISNGDGTFRPPVTYPISVNASQGIAVDLDDDGNVDVVLSNFAGSNLVVLMGRGDGTFDAPKSVESGLKPLGIGAAPFNLAQPGQSIVVVNNGSNNISVLQGDGEGALGARVDIAVGRDPRALVVAAHGRSRSARGRAMTRCRGRCC